MGKIIKYEWRKQRTSRLIILFGLFIFLAAFTISLITDNGIMAACSALFLFLTSFLVIFYVGIESLLVFNKDLRTKQSHMLWMVPKSVWEILGGKFISAILQMLFLFASYVIAGCLSFVILILTFGEISDFFKMIQTIASNLIYIDIDWGFIINLAALLFLSWALIIMVGFLSIIISRTLFLDFKFSGLLSVVLFFVINWIIERGYSLIHNIFNASQVEFSFFDFAYYIVICALLFGASGILADKKLSV